MKKDDVKITVVTITYNLKNAGREHTFRQCVESVHNQTYKNIEHIVVDGASTDGSLDLIKEYADKGWIKYISEKDSGIYDAMNKGLKLATGDYIGFLNSDDYYHDINGIQSVVDTFKSSGADFCYADCNFVTKEGVFYGVSKPVIGSFYAHMPFSHQTLFVDTKLMRKLGGFDSDNFKNAGDYDFIIRLCMSGAKSCQNLHNFVSYRMGGLSEVKHDEGDKEVEKSFAKNYSKFYAQVNPGEMLHNLIIPVRVWEKIYNLVSDEIKKDMKRVWDNGEKINDDFVKINEIQIVHIPEKTVQQVAQPAAQNPNNLVQKKVYLFDFLPIMKTRKRYGCERFLLFGFLPVLKIKYNNDKIKSYLFSVIPFTYTSRQKFRIFGIPLLKIGD